MRNPLYRYTHKHTRICIQTNNCQDFKRYINCNSETCDVGGFTGTSKHLHQARYEAHLALELLSKRGQEPPPFSIAVLYGHFISSQVVFL